MLHLSRINPKLIPLKLLLFAYYGCIGVVFPFFQVILKQKGFTYAHISIAYTLVPVVRFIFPIINGLIVDKIGRPKPVLFGNIIFGALIFSGLYFIPDHDATYCGTYVINTPCGTGRIEIDSNNTCNFSAINKCEVGCLSYNDADISSSNISTNLEDTALKFRNVYVTIQQSNTTVFCKESMKLYLNQKENWCSENYFKSCQIHCHENNEFSNESACTFMPETASNFALAYAYLALLAYYVKIACVIPVINHTILIIVKTHNADYGRQKVWETLGSFVFSILTGFLVDVITTSHGFKDFSILYCIHSVLIVIVLALLYKLDVQTQPPGKKMTQKSVQMLKNTEFLTLCIFLICLGICGSFRVQFVVLFLDSLGASSLLVGMKSALRKVYSVPFLMYSNFLIKKIGKKNLMILAFLAYSVYYLCYSFLYNPWLCLILEATGVFTYYLLWIAVVLYCDELAPEGLTATVISTAQSARFAVGRFVGAMIGGVIMVNNEERTAFRIMSGIAFTCGALYALYLYAGCLFKSRKKTIGIKEQEEMKPKE